MSYSFVRRYNKAYDFFLTRYFNEHGISFDENTSFEEAEVRFKLGCGEPKEMSPAEDLFCAYVRSWGSHRECRPALYNLLSFALGTRDGLDLTTIRKLKTELLNGRGKLIFSEREAADDIAHFYKRYMTDALRRDLRNGDNGGAISKYFSMKEVKQLPNLGKVGAEAFEDAHQRIALELLRWLEQIDSEKILLDTRQLLQEHLKDRAHMQPLDLSKHGDPRPAMDCYHDSSYVKLYGFYRAQDDFQSMTINPERGFRVYLKHNWDDDWSAIVFPQYYIFREE